MNGSILPGMMMDGRDLISMYLKDDNQKRKFLRTSLCTKPMLNGLCVFFFHLILKTTLCNKHYFSFGFTAEKTKVQRGKQLGKSCYYMVDLGLISDLIPEY